MRTWKRPQSIAVLLAVAALGALGCERDTTLLGPTQDSPSTVFSQTELAAELEFVSRVYSDGQTTFTYHLSGVDAPCVECGPPFIAYPTEIMVQLPECAPAPVAYSPSDGVTIYENIHGVYGIEWGTLYDENPNLIYTVTFDGDIAAGDVTGVVQRGSDQNIGPITGPANRYEISGAVFTDADQDNIQDEFELGIANATVTLDDGEGNLILVTTDAFGNYAFSVCPGTYEVRFDPTTEANDVNESLVANFEPMGPASYSVTVGPSSTENDFGFEPDVEAIIEAIEDDEIPTDGKSYRFWRRQVFFALVGLDGVGQHSKEELLAFIAQIQDIALIDEYQFTPGRELLEVFLILNNHAHIHGFDNLDAEGEEMMSVLNLESDERSMSGVTTGRAVTGLDGEEGTFLDNGHDPYAFLLRELLTTEFNHVSGRGLTTALDLQTLLINWGEGVLSDNAPEPDDNDLKAGGPIEALENPVEEAGGVFRKLNGATGGGGSN